MSSRNEATLPATRQPKSRQSIAHSPAESIDKENMTTDIAALGGTTKRLKKSRSKSIGPGGLDTLKDGTGNRRKSIAAPPPRSILKSTMPPLQEIPAHIVARNQKLKEKTLPFGSPDGSIISNPAVTSSDTKSVFGITTLPNPSTSDTSVAETKVLLRTEEQQLATAKEREAKESSEIEVDINKRREARRKSLANRRVSFAPEATLHTWDVVEYLQDSTTSSASTSSTRRASSASTATVDSPRLYASGMSGSESSERPSTPPEQIEGPTTTSPIHQQALYQKKRRRSSGIPRLNFNNPDDELFSSSPSSGSSAVGDENGNQVASTIDDDEISDSNSNSDDEGTAMSLDVGDDTDMSAKSNTSSDGSSALLDEALQLAARQAGTQGVEFDEHGGAGIMEEGVIASFQPWSRKPTTQNPILLNDQEGLSPISLAPQKVHPREERDDDGTNMQLTQAVGRIMPGRQSDDEMAMDMTVAVGRIMSPTAVNSTGRGRKPDVVERRQSIRRRSSGEASSVGDDTMDLTIAIGGIKQSVGEVGRITEVENEDMTMEFTSVIGGVMASNSSSAPKHKRFSMIHSNGLQNRKLQSTVSTADDETMDITVAMGNILPTTLSSTEPDNSTIGMDMTAALGGILPEKLSTTNYESRYAMEEGISHSSLLSSLPTTSQGKVHANTVASETGSPSLVAFKGKGLRRSSGPRSSTTPKSTKATTKGTPTKKPSSPAKQTNPKPSRPTTPNTISLRTIGQNTTSPIRPFKDPSRSDSTTPEANSSRSTPNKLFQRDITTGAPIPSIILTPQTRRSSGLGIDRTGLGSPRVADILDRRRSISDMALAFTSGESRENTHSVVFDNPQLIEEELDKERQEEKDREDGRKIMEREADTAETEKDATANLKEMIESLTPRKRPLKGRKSLHVGTAKGILGKRPTELDQDDEGTDEDQDGVKRLKNHQGSPVKNVKLQAPPSKAETTGRITRATRRDHETTSGNAITPTTTVSPSKGITVTTPKGQGRFRAVDSQLIAQQVPFAQRSPIENPIVDEEEDEAGRMHLQDFLNMTSIRFMELTTTKRRYTVAPNRTQKGIGLRRNSDEMDRSFEHCVVAGACTVPMLELFQHSCRELKKYISEGRSIVQEIENETFEENPPLFREYISATPDIRVLMDNQFKNVKTHARLLSKAMWYGWRMKLLDGLMVGLHKISEGMDADGEILHHRQALLGSSLPSLVEKHDKLAEEESSLRIAAEELANCDQKELSEARQRLVSVETDIEVKRRIIHDLQKQLQEKEAIFTADLERKQVYLDDIQVAEKIRESCRGWSADEGLAFKARVDDLEKRHGWTITGVSGNQVSMTYRREIELVFDTASFKSNRAASEPSRQANTTIDLWYIASNRELNPLPLTTEKDFFLQNIRDYCRYISQRETPINTLLNAVSASWKMAQEIVDNIQSLNHTCPTEITKTSDTSIVVRSILLLQPLKTNVKLEFHVHIDNAQDGIKVDVKPQCSVVYGERYNEVKMSEFLVCRIVENEDRKSWADIVAELKARLLARGRR